MARGRAPAASTIHSAGGQTKHMCRANTADHTVGEITIPLAEMPSKLERRHKSAYLRVVNDEYVTKFLDVVGVSTTNQRYRDLVELEAPLTACNLVPTWNGTSEGTSCLKILQPSVCGKVWNMEAEQKGGDVPRRSIFAVPAPNHQRASAVKLVESSAAASASSSPNASYPLLLPSSSSCVDGRGECAKNLAWTSCKEPDIVRSLTSKVTDDNPPIVDPSVVAAKRRMQVCDTPASRRADPKLVEELEKLRGRLEVLNDGTKIWEHLKPTATQQETCQQRAFEKIKRRYILPFACERPARNASSEVPVVVPWQVLALRTTTVAVPPALAHEARTPIRLSVEHIEGELLPAMLRNDLPLGLLTLRQEVPQAFAHGASSVLLTTSFAKLVGLLSHLIYWDIFGHLHSNNERLAESAGHSLFVMVQGSWSELVEPFRSRKSDVVSGGCGFALPVVLLALKCGVESVFMHEFPDCLCDDDLASSFVDQVNVACMKLFDPDCFLARFACIETDATEVKSLWKRHSHALSAHGLGPTRLSRVRMDRVTPLMHAVLGNGPVVPQDPKTRIQLRKSASEARIRRPQSIGATNTQRIGEDHRSPPMDDRGSSALMHTATRRVSRPPRASSTSTHVTTAANHAAAGIDDNDGSSPPPPRPLPPTGARLRTMSSLADASVTIAVPRTLTPMVATAETRASCGGRPLVPRPASAQQTPTRTSARGLQRPSSEQSRRRRAVIWSSQVSD
eukprot:TRINITY_DN37760_c0_g1_i1.p1 TRINITY_DN37760_c0_g1~~TRINITY_DN37760_c0_g1_i1.p1  ORF type:complete len:767 (-),score=104.49 TRINITY_DN37760_c0_g1_i1:117-2324(-)